MTDILLKLRDLACYSGAVLGFIATASGAYANCQSKGGGLANYRNDTVEQRIETDNGTCMMTIYTDPRLIDMITNVEFLSKPAHGVAQMKDFAVGYWAVKGYQGDDTFTIKVCGKKGSGDGCSTYIVKYSMSNPSTQNVTDAMVKSKINGAVIP